MSILNTVPNCLNPKTPPPPPPPDGAVCWCCVDQAYYAHAPACDALFNDINGIPTNFNAACESFEGAVYPL